MIEECDKDGSGSVDFQEFVEMMIKRENEKETMEDLKQVFRVFDKDGNGFVSTSEIKFVLSKIGIHFTDEELVEMVQEADIDGDGDLDILASSTTSNTIRIFENDGSGSLVILD